MNIEQTPQDLVYKELEEEVYHMLPSSVSLSSYCLSEQ